MFILPSQQPFYMESDPWSVLYTYIRKLAVYAIIILNSIVRFYSVKLIEQGLHWYVLDETVIKCLFQVML